MKRTLLWILAFVGAADCVVIPFLFTSAAQQPFFPFPGLYFIEIALLGLMGMISAVRDRTESLDWFDYIPWIVAGVLLAFNILGGFSIGFYLIPGTLAFLGVGMLLTGGQDQKIWKGVGLFLVSAIAQGVGMLALVNFL